MKNRRTLLKYQSDYVTDGPNLAFRTMPFMIWLLAHMLNLGLPTAHHAHSPFSPRSTSSIYHPSACPWAFAHAIPAVWNVFSFYFSSLSIYSSSKIQIKQHPLTEASLKLQELFLSKWKCNSRKCKSSLLWNNKLQARKLLLLRQVK